MALAPKENVLELIGQTPLLRLRSQERQGGASIYAKLEGFNPGGSVKDRIALGMLEEAQARGLLQPGKGVVIEPTSGNTGVGLAMVCAVKGWRCVLVVPEGLPERRYALLKAYGAELVLTPFELGMRGTVEKAESMLAAHPEWICPMQFRNRANPATHRRSTAREILRALKGRVDAFVAGVGTGGTLTGVAAVLKRRNSKILAVAVEPDASPVLSGGEAGPHRIQGIGAGFVPSVLDIRLIDRIVRVKDTDAIRCSRELARKEGLLVGISSGANVFAAHHLALELGRGKHVVTIACDRGEIYLNQEGELE